MWYTKDAPVILNYYVTSILPVLSHTTTLVAGPVRARAVWAVELRPLTITTILEYIARLVLLKALLVLAKALKPRLVLIF